MGTRIFQSGNTQTSTRKRFAPVARRPRCTIGLGDGIETDADDDAEAEADVDRACAPSLLVGLATVGVDALSWLSLDLGSPGEDNVEDKDELVAEEAAWAAGGERTEEEWEREGESEALLTQGSESEAGVLTGVPGGSGGAFFPRTFKRRCCVVRRRLLSLYAVVIARRDRMVPVVGTVLFTGT
jgi:hypothetical protein